MGHTFISYARVDEDFVSLLASALETAGIAIWLDRRIAAGRHFDDVIDAALDSASAVIVVWSESAVLSQWVRAEASEGLKRRILIPITIDGSRIPLEFRRLQTLDFRSWNARADAREFRLLLDALRTHLDASQTGSLSAEHGASTLSAGAAAKDWSKAKQPHFHRRSIASALLAVLLLAGAVSYNFLGSSDVEEPVIAIGKVNALGPHVPDGLSESFRDELANTLGTEGEVVSLPDQGPVGAATMVLTATIIRSQENLRFAVHLRKAQNGEVIFSQAVDRPYVDSAVGAHQAAVQIAGIIGCGLSAKEYTSLDPKIRSLKFELCQAERDERGSELRKLVIARRLTDLAPHVSDAWSNRALYAASVSENESNPGLAEEASMAAKKALAIDPRNSTAYLAYALLESDQHLAKQESQIRQAIRVCGDRNCADEYDYLGWQLLWAGRVDEGVKAFSSAHRMAPYEPAVVRDYAEALYAAGDYVNANRLVATTAQNWPTHEGLKSLWLRTALATGRFEDVKILSANSHRGQLGETFKAALNAIATNDIPSMGRITDDLLRLSKNNLEAGDQLFLVAVLLKLRRPHAAIAVAVELARQRELSDVLFWKSLDGARGGPVFTKAVNDLQLPRYWRDTGKRPDFCRRSPDAQQLCSLLKG